MPPKRKRKTQGELEPKTKSIWTGIEVYEDNRKRLRGRELIVPMTTSAIAKANPNATTRTK